MNGFLEGIAVAAVPMAGLGAMLVILCVVTYIWELITGDAALPRFVRKKKSPRRKQKNPKTKTIPITIDIRPKT